MFVPLFIAIASCGLGALLGIAGRQRMTRALSTFALVSALSVVLIQLLPDAIEGGGIGAVAVFLAALWAPRALETRLSRTPSGGRLGLELGYAALIVHRFFDGLGLGIYGGEQHIGHGHVDILFAIAAHTVPVIALVTMAFARRSGVHAALRRAAGLGAITVAAVFAAGAIPERALAAWEPWLTAVLAGLLLHVVVHDWAPERVVLRKRHHAVDLLAVLCGVGLVALAGDGHAHGHAQGEALRPRVGAALVDLALDTAPALLFGLVVGAILTLLGSRLPMAWLTRGSSLRQAVRGAVIGAPLPICACGVLPLASALRRRGAGPALVVAFLLATPELGVETFALTVSFLGLPFAIFRLVAAVLLAMVAAWVIHRVARSEGVGATSVTESQPPPKPAPLHVRFTAAFDELLFHIVPWTLVGLIVSAYVQAALPDGFAQTLPVGGLDVLAMTVVAVPSYVCAASATPLAAVLLAKGVSPGAVLVGLLLGPATNVATVAFLRNSYGLRPTLLGVGAAVLLAWGGAALLNAAPFAVATSTRVTAHEHGWLALASAALLVLAILRSIFLTGVRGWLATLGDAFRSDGGHHHHHHHHQGGQCEHAHHGHS